MKSKKSTDKKERDQETVIDKIPQILPVLPLRDTVIFPYMIFPVLVGRDQSISAANYAMTGDKFIFLSAQKKSNVDSPAADEIYQEGTVAKIVQILKLPNGLLKILVDGLLQGRIIKFTNNEEFFEAHIEVIVTETEISLEMSALIRQMSALFKDYVRVNRNIPPEAVATFESIEEPDRKLFYVAANINQSIEVKQKILQTFNLKEQFYEIIRMLKSEIDLLKIEKEIDYKVQENIARTQRRYVIQEQIKILQDELGDEDPSAFEDKKLREAIKKAKMPAKILEKANEELTKLMKIPAMSPEYTVIRNYIDWLLAVPWSKKSKDILNIKHVIKTLNEDHYGLEKPKERILEFIAVLNLVKDLKGQILCLVGPPGVGKTSLGRSIARALGREFVRFSLGGIRDVAEIRGHRRTYIGSLPGKIIQSMKKAGTVNPVILLDEIDKIDSDYIGDPASALLEVLDPEQNNSFNDHYLEVDYDLSNVLFITTANNSFNIPYALFDRMEIIELSGYMDIHKFHIAKDHLFPKQLKAAGLAKRKINVTDEALNTIISDYTQEAGVRNLERKIASIFRKTAKEIVEGEAENGNDYFTGKEFLLDKVKVEKLLGIPKFKSRRHQNASQSGFVTGLAYTSGGGDILDCEVVVMRGRERLMITGQTGATLKESAQAGYSYIRSKAFAFNLHPNFYRNKEIHIHLPLGAVPKDGPSAGITLVMAMISALTNTPASQKVAMTGEISLSGRVMAIGGLPEKLMAAKRYGINKVLVPKENEPDISEIHAEIKEDLEIIMIERIEEAMPHVFPNWIKLSEDEIVSKYKQSIKLKNEEEEVDAHPGS